MQEIQSPPSPCNEKGTHNGSTLSGRQRGVCIIYTKASIPTQQQFSHHRKYRYESQYRLATHCGERADQARPGHRVSRLWPSGQTDRARPRGAAHGRRPDAAVWPLYQGEHRRGPTAELGGPTEHLCGETGLPLRSGSAGGGGAEAGPPAGLSMPRLPAVALDDGVRARVSVAGLSRPGMPRQCWARQCRAGPSGPGTARRGKAWRGVAVAARYGVSGHVRVGRVKAR